METCKQDMFHHLKISLHLIISYTLSFLFVCGSYAAIHTNELITLHFIYHSQSTPNDYGNEKRQKWTNETVFSIHFSTTISFRFNRIPSMHSVQWVRSIGHSLLSRSIVDWLFVVITFSVLFAMLAVWSLEIIEMEN